MSELALKLIREAKEQRLTRLDLGNCGLVELPDELFELVWLEELILANEWSIYNKRATNWECKKSKNRNRPNQIQAIPQQLKSLVKLRQFIAAGNHIQDIRPLATLKHIKSLDLSNNKLSTDSLRPITMLKQLQLLDLSTNQITSLEPLIKLKQLQSLYLTHNQISDITSIIKLHKLQSLDLSYNKISDITPLVELSNLQLLDLSSNKISDITPIARLSNLQLVNLQYNQIRDLIPLMMLLKTERLAQLEVYKFENSFILFNNPIENPPKEIVEQGNAAILNYFKALEEQGAEPLNEAKLIIVGEPAAGKTTLMETLLDPDFVLCDTSSTLGVEVREGWQFTHPQQSETEFSANIWDFGGQQIQYMTHQFFLTPSAVYVLVSANDRKEPTNFPYWFKIIHLLGEEQGRYSPVLVVLNEKNDKFINKFNFDRKLYEKRYPELQIEVCEVDLSKRDEYFQIMRNTIQRMLSRLPHVADPRPARWRDIRDALRERAQIANHISFAEYAAICSEHSVKGEASQLVFSRYLHKLGSLLHFTDDPSLHNFIILKPQWAVDAVYSVLNDNQVAKNDGYFNRAQLETIWKDKYNFDERCKLLSLMQKENFEICYPLSLQDFIAPQLLNAERPTFIWDEQDNLRFRFQYKFMPEGIITRLMVRLHELLACGEQGKQLIWRKGAVFIKNGSRALVQEEENRESLKIIDIAINGKISERKYLLREIRDAIHAIHRKWFRNIQVEQMIPCICSYCTNPEHKDPRFFEEDVLNRALERGRETVECDKEFIDVSVKSLLEGVFERNETNQFISGREQLMVHSTYITMGDSSQFIVGDHNTQKSHSDNTTLTSTTITADQRKIISAVVDQIWEHRAQLDKNQRKTVRDLQDVIEAEVADTTPETQSKLGKAWQELQGITDFTNNSLEVGAKVVQYWPAITGWLTAAAAYFGN